MKFINSFRESFIYFPSRVISPLHFPMFHSPLILLWNFPLYKVCAMMKTKSIDSRFSQPLRHKFVLCSMRGWENLKLGKLRKK